MYYVLLPNCNLITYFWRKIYHFRLISKNNAKKHQIIHNGLRNSYAHTFEYTTIIKILLSILYVCIQFQDHFYATTPRLFVSCYIHHFARTPICIHFTTHLKNCLFPVFPTYDIYKKKRFLHKRILQMRKKVLDKRSYN